MIHSILIDLFFAAGLTLAGLTCAACLSWWLACVTARNLRRARDAAGGIAQIHRLQDFWDTWRPKVHHKRRGGQRGSASKQPTV